MTLGFVTFVDVTLLNQQTGHNWISDCTWFVGLITPHRSLSGFREGDECEITKPKTNGMWVSYCSKFIGLIISHRRSDGFRMFTGCEITKPTNAISLGFGR